MSDHYWALVVESNESDLTYIEFAMRSVAPHVNLVAIASFDDFISTITSCRSLPTVAILDWNAPGAAQFLGTLDRLGFRNRFPMVATARVKAMEALDESFHLGVPRFVCKLPDDFTFKKKVAEAIADYVPGAKKVLPPEAVLKC